MAVVAVLQVGHVSIAARAGLCLDARVVSGEGDLHVLAVNALLG